MMLGQALRKEKNSEYTKMRKIYGVNDERSQLAKISYLQKKYYNHRLICRTLHEHNGMIIIYYIFKVQYPMYIEIRVQWNIHKMGCKFKQCDKYVIIQELTCR